jgi:NAD(P)-dependent dehydrogenase (short-subunit alcohol dehydrogenase family)
MTDTDTQPHGTAVITGAGSERGIGRELAKRLAPAGWSLALIDREASLVAALAAELADAHGIHALGLGADVADPSSVDAAITEVETALPAVQALVNIAGISSPVPFLALDLETWERVLRVNATGTFVVTRRVMPGLVERKYGRVVNLGSTAMQNGGGTYSKSSYAASKVNVVAPATIDTDIMGGRITDDRAGQFLSQLPVGRLGTTREVAALIDFLIGEEAGYITGATYNINGGIRIG